MHLEDRNSKKLAKMLETYTIENQIRALHVYH